MKTLFQPVDPALIHENPFHLIGKDWMLVTAGTLAAFNPMTASWGGLGVLWHRPVCFCFIRPTRHTFGFMERGAHFTLSFFEEQYREALSLCGTRSGRELDKASAAGLTPLAGPTGAVAFAEARLVLECRKIYFQDLDPARFLDPAIEENYPEKDYHRCYIGEIVHGWMKPPSA